MKSICRGEILWLSKSRADSGSRHFLFVREKAQEGPPEGDQGRRGQARGGNYPGGGREIWQGHGFGLAG